ncbi:SGNH/GDSL hydrolase family protein [soil metagenome]
MRQFQFSIILVFATVLAGCGGSDAGDQSPKIKFSSQVTFGDSLSDVGTYAVGGIAAAGGGKYTINDVGSDGKNKSKNWTELIAAQLGLPAPCAAQTGLDGDAALGFSVPVVKYPACTGYAQGGSRVTNPVGPRNKLLGAAGGGSLGQLTVPVVTQIQNHLAANGGKFKGDEIVFVMAGGNDLLMQVGALQSGATAAATAAVTAAVPGQIAQNIQKGTCVPADAQASNCVAAAVAALTPTVGAAAANTYVQTNAPAAVTAMGVAGAELAGYVKTLILGNGAKYVTVVNLPDASTTPDALRNDAATVGLIATLASTFNSQLKAGLGESANLLYVDAFAINRDWVSNPVQYGLTNVKDTACDLTPAKNPLAFSLICNKSNLTPGVVDNYLFADGGGHVTPYGYTLLARAVSKDMIAKGWL